MSGGLLYVVLIIWLVWGDFCLGWCWDSPWGCSGKDSCSGVCVEVGGGVCARYMVQNMCS